MQSPRYTIKLDCVETVNVSPKDGRKVFMGKLMKMDCILKKH